MLELLVRYFHFIGIIALSACLVAQNILLKPQIDSLSLKTLGRIDIAYGMAAGITFAAGLALWLFVGKPKEFYSGNPLFHLKVSLFVTVAVLSIAPTLFFFKHRHTSGIFAVPTYIRLLKRSELLFLIILPLLAVSVAKGMGL